MLESISFQLGLLIDVWNSLPGSIIHSNTVNTFKVKIDCLLKNRGYIYIYISYQASFLLLATFFHIRWFVELSRVELLVLTVVFVSIVNSPAC